MELGGLQDEQSLHGLLNHDQGYPLGCKPPRLGHPPSKTLTPDPTPQDTLILQLPTHTPTPRQVKL